MFHFDVQINKIFMTIGTTSTHSYVENWQLKGVPFDCWREILISARLDSKYFYVGIDTRETNSAIFNF